MGRTPNGQMYPDHPGDGRSKLERWVFEVGGSGCAALIIDTHQQTICGWVGRRVVPSLEMACRMIKASKGYLTAQDILDSTKPW